ncbi:MAG: FtsH protease activity modulator HflK [Alphaproteobacteria bacterium]|jgi:modulator of FtsH protease HflK|nr:FtsH protease activity modulator HflK [Alphaproteobacteria bacterium]MBT5390352.1 FtsH protease activity modulator HflK [Alphaproteobacteria bacterium]MBT5540959.1 FtsH protease activity modulator HflK [Alphaproteobacteria bacterium]MBT5654612.1 FtsH protease activity modulator HflK [Alphaproteobacteria bacterium]
MSNFAQGGGEGPWGGGPWGGDKPTPKGPTVEQFFQKGKKEFGGFFPNGFGGKKGILIAVLVAFVLWLGTGIYRVDPDEKGVVLRFGKFVRKVEPGLNYHLPVPIETVFTPKVTRVQRVEIGYRSGKNGRGTEHLEESLMLTGDENIIDINFTIFWFIKNAESYLFKVRSPEETVKAVAESVMRDVVGQMPIAVALAEGRKDIEERVLAHLQEILNEYNSGIEITQVELQRVDPPNAVIDAFRDVQRARADQERMRNEAEGYRNQVIPHARGAAAKLLQEAEAYKQQITAKAQGDAKRFESVLNAYKTAPDVTRKRIYLETLEEILTNTNKIVLDEATKGQGVLPYLPLPAMKAHAETDKG